MKKLLTLALYAASLSASPVSSILCVSGATSTAVLELDDSLHWQRRVSVPQLFTAMSATGELVVGNPAGTSLTEVWKYAFNGTPLRARVLTEAYEAFTPFSSTEVLAYSRTRGMKLISAHGERAFCSASSLRRPLWDVTLVHRGGNEILIAGSTKPTQPNTSSNDYVCERVWLTAPNNCSLAYAVPLPYHSTGNLPALVGDDAVHAMLSGNNHRLHHVDLRGGASAIGKHFLATAGPSLSPLEAIALGDAHPLLPASVTGRVAYYRSGDHLIALPLDGSAPVTLAANLFEEGALRSVAGLSTGSLKIVHKLSPTQLAGFGGLTVTARASAEAPAPAATPSVKAPFLALWASAHGKGLVPTAEPPEQLPATALVLVIEGQPMASEWLHFALRELATNDRETLGVEWRGVNWSATGSDKTVSLTKLLELVTPTKSCQALLVRGS